MGVVLRKDRRKLNLAKEARFHPGFVDQIGFEYLDHTIGIAFDLGVLCAIDGSETSFSQHADQSVFSSDLKERKVTMDAKAQRSAWIVIGGEIHLAMRANSKGGVRHQRGEPRGERMAVHAGRCGLRAWPWLFRSDATALSRARPSCGPSLRSHPTLRQDVGAWFLPINRRRSR